MIRLILTGILAFCLSHLFVRGEAVNETEAIVDMKPTAALRPENINGWYQSYRLRRESSMHNVTLSFQQFEGLLSALPWERLGFLFNQFLQMSFKEISNPNVMKKIIETLGKEDTKGLKDMFITIYRSMPGPLRLLLENLNGNTNSWNEFLTRKTSTMSPLIKFLLGP